MSNSMLDTQVAAYDAHARWPHWTFTRTRAGWQAKEISGLALFVGGTLEQVDTRAAQHDWMAGPSKRGE